MMTTKDIPISFLRAGDVFRWGHQRVTVTEEWKVTKRTRVSVYGRIMVKLEDGNVKSLGYEIKEWVIAEIAGPA